MRSTFPQRSRRLTYLTVPINSKQLISGFQGNITGADWETVIQSIVYVMQIWFGQHCGMFYCFWGFFRCSLQPPEYLSFNLKVMSLISDVLMCCWARYFTPNCLQICTSVYRCVCTFVSVTGQMCFHYRELRAISMTRNCKWLLSFNQIRQDAFLFWSNINVTSCPRKSWNI